MSTDTTMSRACTLPLDGLINFGLLLYGILFLDIRKKRLFLLQSASRPFILKSYSLENVQTRAQKRKKKREREIFKQKSCYGF